MCVTGPLQRISQCLQCMGTILQADDKFPNILLNTKANFVLLFKSQIKKEIKHGGTITHDSKLVQGYEFLLIHQPIRQNTTLRGANMIHTGIIYIVRMLSIRTLVIKHLRQSHAEGS